jgi:hypothetical protein
MSVHRWQRWVLAACLTGCVAWGGNGCGGSTQLGSGISGESQGAPPSSEQAPTGAIATGAERKAKSGTAPNVVGLTQTVSGGTTAQSTHYQMVFTLGQPTPTQGTSKSPGYQMQGGIVGANGRLK